ILSLIAAMQARHGAALLFVTHDLGVVAKVCQRVSVLYAGKVVECADTPSILEAPGSSYTKALLAASPRYDRPEQELIPVDPAIIAHMRAEIADADKRYLAR
ncbi:MAG: ABC transporter ATP-binding protein, partial [Pseudomonadota bacterium]